MSNFLAIATVTEALRQSLEAAIIPEIPGAAATAVRPSVAHGAEGPPKSGINVFLYQVSPNGAARNRDLPSRDANGQAIQKTQAALDLHYLISFYGHENQLEPQRLLGRVVERLHAKPILTRGMIDGATRSLSFVAKSNLADEPEPVRFTLLPLSLEELSKLWSVFFQTPYVLSLAYQGSVVRIDAGESSVAALPVRERMFHVSPFRQPAIRSVTSAQGDREPILSGGRIVIQGDQLQGEEVRLRFGAVEQVVGPVDVSDRQIVATIPAALPAGVHGIQIIHPLRLGHPPKERGGVESNVFPIVLQPSLSGVSATSTGVALTVSPPVGKDQRVVLLLHQDATPAARYAFALNPRTSPSSSLTVPIQGVVQGSYFVRLQVDGAASPVDLDPASPRFGPRVPIP